MIGFVDRHLTLYTDGLLHSFLSTPPFPHTPLVPRCRIENEHHCSAAAVCRCRQGET